MERDVAPSSKNQPIRLQAGALLILGVLLLPNATASPLFAAAAGIWGYLFYITVVKRQALHAITAAVFGSISGLSLVSSQSFALVFDLFDAAGGHLLRISSVVLATGFLLTALYTARSSKYATRIVFLPYLLTLLMAASIYLTFLEVTQITAATAGPSLPGGLQFFSLPNLCSPGQIENIICGLCPVLGLGSSGEALCFHKSLGVIAVALSGAISGHVYGNGKPRSQRALSTVGTLLAGIILSVLVLTFL